MRCLSAHKKKSVLITGIGGFIGRHVSGALAGKYNIIGVGSGLSNTPGITMDLRRKKKVQTFFKDYKGRNDIHCIIHLASRFISSDNIEDMSVFYDNIKITESVVAIAKLIRPKRFINFSSIAVYPAVNGKFTETSMIWPAKNTECLYGLSKFCGENIIDFMLKDTGIQVASLRVAQVYGEGMRSDRIMSIMKQELLSKNTVTVLGNGRRISSFIRVEDLARAVKRFVENSSQGVFNIGNENMSYLELAEKIINMYGNKKSRIIKVPAGSRAEFYLNDNKFRNIVK